VFGAVLRSARAGPMFHRAGYNRLDVPSGRSEGRSAAGGVPAPWARRTPKPAGEGGGEAVVVAGDVDTAGGQVHDRLIQTAMPVFQLVGAQAEGQGQDLAAQADAEDGQPGIQHSAHRFHRVGGGCRVTRSVAEEHPVWRGGEDLPGARGGRHHEHLAAPRREVPRRSGLDAEVDGDHAVPGLAGGTDGVALGRAHHTGEVGSGHLRAGQHPVEQPGRIGLGRADRRPHRTALAYPPGQYPRTADGDAGYVPGAQVGVKIAAGAPA